jgi:hypothetical protein
LFGVALISGKKYLITASFVRLRFWELWQLIEVLVVPHRVSWERSGMMPWPLCWFYSDEERKRPPTEVDNAKINSSMAIPKSLTIVVENTPEISQFNFRSCLYIRGNGQSGSVDIASPSLCDDTVSPLKQAFIYRTQPAWAALSTTLEAVEGQIRKASESEK